jgi:hypothetical protein
MESFLSDFQISGFFIAQIRNPYIRRAYSEAVRQFSTFVEVQLRGTRSLR